MLDWLGGDFTGGAITAISLVLAILFLKYWRATKDFLFFAFSAAFALLALSQLLQSLTPSAEDAPWNFVLRLIAFLFISVAIVRKNIRRSG